MTIHAIATGVKIVGGAIGGASVTKMLETGCRTLISTSPEVIFTNPLVEQVAIKAAGLTGGVIAVVCIDKKVDDIEKVVTTVVKIINQTKEELKNKEQNGLEPVNCQTAS